MVSLLGGNGLRFKDMLAVLLSHSQDCMCVAPQPPAITLSRLQLESP